MTNLLQIQTDIIIDFFDSWGLKTNLTKTKAICFSKKLNNITDQLNIQHQNLVWQEKMEYLGVILDRKLTFTSHIKKITSNCWGRTFRLSLILRNSTPYYSSLIYKSYTRPLLTYASPIWFPLISLHQQKKLQITQNKILRYATFLPRSTPIPTLHDITGTPTLSNFILNRLLPNFANTLVKSDNPTLTDPLTTKFLHAPKYPSLNYIYTPDPT